MNNRMGFKEAVASVFRKYAEFQGRARRSEYWYFCLFNFLIYSLSSVVYIIILAAGVSGGSSGSLIAAFSGGSVLTILYGIYSLAIIIPSLAVACRRLHDIGRAGSYLLFAFIPIVGFIFLLIWFLQEGDPGTNRYGPDPKTADSFYADHLKQLHADKHYDNAQPVRRDNIPGPPEQYGGSPSFYLEGAAGFYRGKHIPIRGTVIAGRDPGCTVSFPRDSHGVSHRHCRFQVNGSSVVVTDLGSSYGTFINGRNKLKPNASVALSPGDSIGLGSQKQCFRLMQK